MQLSVIIVSYNVRYFLEQCLCSVQKAVRPLDAEIIVVDNASSDGSADYLGPLFPQVRFIRNTENTGFAKANNLALKECKGEYILFLNPDTLIPADCLEKCIGFIQAHPQTGAVGVRMLDGQGRFLPESKRSFPYPLASLFKLTGLAALFPRSRFFNKYALGHLAEEQDHEVEVLAGAFFLSRKTLLDELQGFDERFFLYGEDIDLSSRIRDAGWQNHYLGSIEIIHFKGESSGRTRRAHAKFFYSAMLLFIQKHYKKSMGAWFSLLLRIAVVCRSALGIAGYIIKPFILPLADAVLTWLSLELMREVWIRTVRNGVDFHVPFISYGLPLFSVLFVLAAAFAGLYDKWFRMSRVLPALAFALLCLLATYSLLPETMRFSRGVILTGGSIAAVLITGFRVSFFRKMYRWLEYEWDLPHRSVVIGTEEEYASVQQLLKETGPQGYTPGRIDPVENTISSPGLLQELDQARKKRYIREIIFCVGELSLSRVIGLLKQLPGIHIRFLFHLSGSQSIIGSDLPGVAGRSIGRFMEYRIADPYQLRMKRIIDILVALFLFITAPLQLVLHKRSRVLLKNAWQVLTGRKTWVGYIYSSDTLPPLRPAVMTHGIPGAAHREDAGISDRLYAKNYDWWQDLARIIRRYFGKGQNTII